MHTLPSKQIISGIIIALAVFVIIFDLVRRGKLREEYSWFSQLRFIKKLYTIVLVTDGFTSVKTIHQFTAIL